MTVFLSLPVRLYDMLLGCENFESTTQVNCIVPLWICCFKAECVPISLLQDSSGYGGGRNYAGDGTSQTGGGYSGHPPVPGGPKPFDFKEWPSS